MIINVFSSFLLLLFFSTALMAGDEKGNGGDVLICPDRTPKYEVFDIFEARFIRRFPLDLGANALSVDEKMLLLLERLNKYSPTRARLYQQWYQEFMQEAQFFADIDLGEVNDSDHILIPAGCKIKQIIIQREVSLPGDKRYIIDKNLWDHLDNDNIAALIMHELIYREMNQETSVHVRYFNSFLFSDKISQLTKAEFILLLRRVGLNSLEIQNLVVDLDKPFSYYANGNLQKAYPTKESLFYYHQQWLKPSNQISFYSNGNVARMIVRGEYKFNSPQYATEFTFFNDLNFHKNGRVQSAYLENPLHLSIPQGELQKIKYKISFYANGTIKEASINGGYIEYRGQRIDLFNFPHAFMKIKFYATGKPQLIPLSKTASFSIKGRAYRLDNKISFDDRENIIAASSARSEKVFVSIQKQTIALKNFSDLTFFPTGQLQCFTPGQRIKLKNQKGQEKYHDKNHQVCLDKDDLVVTISQFALLPQGHLHQQYCPHEPRIFFCSFYAPG